MGICAEVIWVHWYFVTAKGRNSVHCHVDYIYLLVVSGIYQVWVNPCGPLLPFHSFVLLFLWEPSGKWHLLLCLWCQVCLSLPGCIWLFFLQCVLQFGSSMGPCLSLLGWVSPFPSSLLLSALPCPQFPRCDASIFS